MRGADDLDRQIEQRPQSLDDLLTGDAAAQPLVQREACSEVGERVARDGRADALRPQHEVIVLPPGVRLDPGGKHVAGRDYYQTVNPATQEVLAEVAAGGEEEVNAAVAAAKGSVTPVARRPSNVMPLTMTPFMMVRLPRARTSAVR